MTTKRRATIEDLYHVPEDGKAELVNGELVIMEPAGFLHGRAAGKIYLSLQEYERRKGSRFAIPANVGFRVHLPNRESFSPDAAFYTGEPTGMKFLEGARICSRSAQRRRLRPRGRGEDGREARRLLRGRHAGGMGCGSARR